MTFIPSVPQSTVMYTSGTDIATSGVPVYLPTQLTGYDVGEIDHIFRSEDTEVTLQPGEWITMVARGVSGTNNTVSISLNTREDQ